MYKSTKEQSDKKVIHSVLRKNSENELKEMKTHFVYAGYHYSYGDRLKSFILEGIKECKIESVMVTSLYMRKFNLIRKETMEKYFNGEEDRKYSINDDLESIFEDLRFGKEPDKWNVTYFLPKLTKEELELVEKKDTNYLQTFVLSGNLDVEFVNVYGWRETITIKNTSENSFPLSFERLLFAQFPKSIHYSIEDIHCPEDCALDCPSNFKRFHFKNGELVKMTDENRIGQGGSGFVFKGLFHGEEKAMKCVFIENDLSADLELCISEFRIHMASGGTGIIAPEAFVRQQNQEQDKNGKWIKKNYNVYVLPLYDCNLYELHEKHFGQFTEEIIGFIIHQCFNRKSFYSRYQNLLPGYGVGITYPG